MNRNIFSKRSTVREARLKLMIAYLLIAGGALWTRATATDERNRNAISDVPFDHVFADGCDDARQFVTGNVRWLNIRVVPNPAMPVAAADACGHDFDNDAMCFGYWVGNIPELWWCIKSFVNDGFH
jgi:hypothetical protein